MAIACFNIDNVVYALQQYHECARILGEKGLRGPQRMKFLVEEGAGHHEGAWRWRLSGALTFLASGWYNS